MENVGSSCRLIIITQSYHFAHENSPKVHEMVTDTVYSREVYMYLLLKISQNNRQLPVYVAMEVANESIDPAINQPPASYRSLTPR